MPEEYIADEELRRAVLREIWQLPMQQRQALVDKYVAAKSMTEMAEQYGKSVKAVESLLGRARAALRRRLSPGASADGVGGGDR